MDQPLFLHRFLSGARLDTHTPSALYRNALIIFIALLFITALGAHLSFEHTFLAERLLPAPKSLFSWSVATSSDADSKGGSAIRLNDATQSVDYTFTISNRAAYSYASVDLAFREREDSPSLVNFSPYTHLRFHAKCSPRNILSLTLHTFDKQFSHPHNPETYRIPMTFFSCDEQWTQVDVDLRHLEIPEWWLRHHQLPLSDRHYDLRQVSGLSFGISVQSPRDVESTAKIVELELRGRDWTAAYLYATCTAALWLAYAFWLFRKHTQVLVTDLKEKIQKDRPLIAYQQLSVEPHRDKEKSAVLRYMATEYANPDINLEAAIAATGVNRSKINSILKDETGLTFSAYLNKLRLTEAARLLADEPEANVAEIAFSVGYNNASYFNKLFKNEYGCSPKAFKTNCAPKRHHGYPPSG